MSALPLIGIPACYRQMGAHPFHIAGDKYIRAVSQGAGGIPVVIPALGTDLDLEQLLDRLDGLLVTGSPSNVEPRHYNGPASAPGTDHDPARDATTLPLIRKAIERGIPLFGICRGFQELNVALGGSLHQKVQEVPGKMDHREDKTAALEVQYGLIHKVELTEGGMLSRLLGGEREITVNSIHQQGIDRLSDCLTAEAIAPDGLVEAVSLKEGKGFALAVQWHPEWHFWENAASTAILHAFGEATRRYSASR